MEYIHRQIEAHIRAALNRKKSVLLLGPRQTGKTTLVMHQFRPDISYSFARAEIRLRYESHPELLIQELEDKFSTVKNTPLIFIDEVQKIPAIMDSIQYLIDNHVAQFILTGSSARKLKHSSNINLLPGRFVALTMDALNFIELPQPKFSLEELLLYGSLPGILSQESDKMKEVDLNSYVSTYLEEEIRAEALVRNIGAFSRFLELSASDAGLIVNFTKLSQEIGVADSTIAAYYQILEDCLIAQRIDPIIKSISHRRLIKSPKYLFFDLGVKRVCANEGIKLSSRQLGSMFEQFVGIELLRFARLSERQINLKYWRDAAGPEIDYVLDVEKTFIPVEVKWSASPGETDAKYLKKFLHEYAQAKVAYVICQTPRRFKLLENIIALPWQEMSEIFKSE